MKQKQNHHSDIIGQGIDMLGREVYEKNVGIPDVKIKPDLHEFNMMSFNPQSIDTILVRGRKAALEQDELLQEVARVTAGRYDQKEKPRAFDFKRDSLVISDIDIKGVLPPEKALLKERLHLTPGTKIDRDGLEHIVAQIYGTQAYDYVTYELLGDKEPYRLVLNCRKGPVHQFGLGVRADTEEIVSVLINVGLNAHSLYGHTYDFIGKISANPFFQVRWSYDMPKMPTINANASVRWTDLSMLNFGDNRLSLTYLNARQEMYLSNLKWKRFDIRGGLRSDIFDIRDIKSIEIIGDYDFSQLSNDFFSMFVDAETDTFDDGYFPEKGASVGLSYSWTFAGMPVRIRNFHTLQFDAKGVFKVGDSFAFIPSVDFRFLMGTDVPVAYFNAIGGSLPGRYMYQQIPFVGITHVAAMKNILTVFRTDYRVTLMKNHYLTGILNYARDCDVFRDYGKGLGYFGAALEYSFDTIFGPISANVHWSNISRSPGVYLSVGYSF